MTTFQADLAETRYVDGASARFAYRRLGARSGVPLVMALRFRGTIDHWISVLDTLKGLEGYDTILIGHDLPTDQSGFHATMAYLRKARECYTQAPDGTSYAEALKAAFPDRLQPGWVDFSGRVLFSTPRREPPPAELG